MVFTIPDVLKVARHLLAACNAAIPFGWLAPARAQFLATVSFTEFAKTSVITSTVASAIGIRTTAASADSIKLAPFFDLLLRLFELT